MTELITIVIAYVPLALLRGWVIALLWGWYVTDYFGAPPLTIVEAVGLGIFVSLFTATPATDEEKDRPLIESILWSILFPLLALGFGWAWSFVR